jgi:universal stress protein A
MLLKVLAALDGSERAPAVLDVAAAVARLSGARLYVVRAISVPPEFPAAAAGSLADPLVAQLAANAMRDLSRLVAAAPESVSVEPPIVRVGVAWKVVLQTADERGVDLIVVGSHGYHGWDRILGTTAGKIANIAKHNVLIVHERKHDMLAEPKEKRREPLGESDLSDEDEIDADGYGAKRFRRSRSMN